MSARGLSLMSGGLDSQLAVRVLERAGAEVEAIAFSSPFFKPREAERAAAALGVKLRVIDFTDELLKLVKAPPHGFGGAMNPCIDCHAAMIRLAGELMMAEGLDFVATGEVLGQRPMSQNRQSLGVVERSSGLKGRLVRPLSALLLEPTVPEQEGKLDRSRLLDISGRSRERQLQLAAEFGIVDFPSPAGGCKLTEAAFSRKLRDLMEHEGLADRSLVELLNVARRFRLPGGTGVALGRDQTENAQLREFGAGRFAVLAAENAPGPTALLTTLAGEGDLATVAALIAAYSKCDRLADPVRVAVRLPDGAERHLEVPRPYDRRPFAAWQLT